MRAARIVVRCLIGGGMVAAGAQLLEHGFDLLTRPNPARVVKAAEDATRAAADVPDPSNQEGPSC